MQTILKAMAVTISVMWFSINSWKFHTEYRDDSTALLLFLAGFMILHITSNPGGKEDEE